MKSTNKTILFFKILGVHFLAYYIPFGIIYQGAAYLGKGWDIFNFKFLLHGIGTSFIGILGWDGFLLYISMIVMAIFLTFFSGFFKAYYSAVIFVGLGALLFLIASKFDYLTRGSCKESIYIIKHFIYILPSSVISIGVNWLVFQKTYRRLREETKHQALVKDDNNE